MPVDLQPYVELAVGETAAAKALGLKPDTRHPPPSPPRNSLGLSISPATAARWTGSSSRFGIGVAIGVITSVWIASGSRL